MAGAAGGMKDVPEAVAAHPLAFFTPTAPSFGPVHTAKKPGRPGSRRCTPRSGDRRQVCPHGRPLWCMTIHDHGDGMTGQPLCADCYDYAGHLVWQWWHHHFHIEHDQLPFRLQGRRFAVVWILGLT